MPGVLPLSKYRLKGLVSHPRDRLSELFSRKTLAKPGTLAFHFYLAGAKPGNERNCVPLYLAGVWAPAGSGRDTDVSFLGS